jgi:hypothetical protein
MSEEEPSLIEICDWLEKRMCYDMYRDYACAEKALEVVKQRLIDEFFDEKPEI